MKFSSVALTSALLLWDSVHGFAPMKTPCSPSSPTALMGYLDDLSAELNQPDANPIPDEESREANAMAKEDVDRAGPGSWDSYVEFHEFDGGDGQMGVAGDGQKGLDKFDTTQMAKSKTMSAKNAWGTSTGYADSLVAKGVDTAKAQQLENW